MYRSAPGSTVFMLSYFWPICCLFVVWTLIDPGLLFPISLWLMNQLSFETLLYSYFNVHIDIQIFVFRLLLHIFITRETNLQGISDKRILSLNSQMYPLSIFYFICPSHAKKPIQYFLGLIKIHVNGLSCMC